MPHQSLENILMKSSLRNYSSRINDFKGWIFYRREQAWRTRDVSRRANNIVTVCLVILPDPVLWDFRRRTTSAENSTFPTSSGVKVKSSGVTKIRKNRLAENKGCAKSINQIFKIGTQMCMNEIKWHKQLEWESESPSENSKKPNMNIMFTLLKLLRLLREDSKKT